MCIDRKRENFYAASTDNCVYEFSLDGSIEPSEFQFILTCFAFVNNRP